jgi:predicted nucleic acid-binding Zn ribbon protein
LIQKILKKEDFKMPLHEYKCKDEDCQHVTLKLFFGSEEVPEWVDCEECHALAYKIISIASFHMKGYSAKNRYSNADFGQGADGPKTSETRTPEGKRYNKNAPPPKRLQEAQLKKAKSTLDD